MGEGTLIEAAAGQRYVIERPRLTKLLDETNARIILLVAPAGYGKTTLAREWLHNDESLNVVWYRGPRGSRDVATVASAVARAAAAVARGADMRLLNYVSSVSSPEAAVDALAEMLAADLSTWPADAWLAIDDYHQVAGFESAERFIELVADMSPTRLLLTSRYRPSWVPTRRVLYGEVLEIGQRELALTPGEARAVLKRLPADTAERVITAAKGWPAVVRLAAISGEMGTTPTELPAALYQYFAEELYQAAPEDIRQGLLRLAALPSLTPTLVELALGERAERVRAAGAELGFLTPDPQGGLELHPLLQAFLDLKSAENVEARVYVREVVEALTAEQQWNEAFAIIERFALTELLPKLFTSALDSLLRANYVSTLEAWLAYATHAGCDFALLDLAEAEVRSRRGQLHAGEVRAIQAAKKLEKEGSDRASRAYATAGDCAHRDLRHEDARDYYRRAGELASDPADVQHARWGEFISACQSERSDATHYLARFEEVNDDTPSAVLRAAAGRLMLSALGGSLDAALDQCSRFVPLVERGDDPFATTHFLYRLAYTHAFNARYVEASRLADQAADEATRTGLAFVLPSAIAAQTTASIGLRHFRRAEMQLARLEYEAQRLGNHYEAANARALRARLQLATGSPEDADAELRGWPAIRETSMRNEWAALRALALAVQGDCDGGIELAQQVMAESRNVQTVTLCHLTQTVVSLSKDPDASRRLTELEAVLMQCNDFDSLVVAYRAFPELLKRLCERHCLDIHRLERVVRGARDLRLAASVGWALPRPSRRESPLSRREREVFELVRKGLTNREIAQELVISEVTVKVHVRHILEKLGARSRAEAVARLQDDA